MSNQPSANIGYPNISQIEANMLVTYLTQEHPIFYQLLVDLDLLETVTRGVSSQTLLVPPESVVAALPASLTQDTPRLKRIILYHIISNTANLANNQGGRPPSRYPLTISIGELLVPPEG